MAGFTISPQQIESVDNAKSFHPLLHLLRIMLAEAYNYHRTTSTASPQQRDQGKASIVNLLHQVEFLWYHLSGAPMEKYESIRARLAIVLLWQRDSAGFSRSVLNPPVHMPEVHRLKRVEVLLSLRNGALFVNGSNKHLAL